MLPTLNSEEPEKWITLKEYTINARGNELKTLNERLITHDNQKTQP
jgi:hypothetical protein